MTSKQFADFGPRDAIQINVWCSLYMASLEEAAVRDGHVCSHLLFPSEFQ